jgi:hypothetical protein
VATIETAARFVFACAGSYDRLKLVPRQNST